MNLSIVIPCYNEEQNIPILFEKISKSYQKNSEIILVNNGSTDKTKEVLSNELKNYKNPFFKLVNIEKNIGYGHGIMSGVKEAKGKFISWTHADLQTDINDIYFGYEKHARHQDDNFFFLKGKRNKRPFLDSLLTWGMGKICSRILGYRFKDINAQPKMFHKTFLNYIDKEPDDFSLDLYFYFIALKNNFKIIEIPVYFNKRLHGEAKGGGGSSLWTRVKIIRRTLNYIYNLEKYTK